MRLVDCGRRACVSTRKYHIYSDDTFVGYNSCVPSLCLAVLLHRCNCAPFCATCVRGYLGSPRLSSPGEPRGPVAPSSLNSGELGRAAVCQVSKSYLVRTLRRLRGQRRTSDRLTCRCLLYLDSGLLSWLV